MRPSSRFYWRWVLAIFFVGAGANHFLNPAPYLAMMPPYLPWPAGLVWVSGIAEILGGLGLLARPLRAPAAWGLIALLVAVFPANLNVALHGWPGTSLPAWSLWLRLPLQPLLIWWIYRTCLAEKGESRLST
jgi:uncharacterized membrane protein